MHQYHQVEWGLKSRMHHVIDVILNIKIFCFFCGILLKIACWTGAVLKSSQQPQKCEIALNFVGILFFDPWGDEMSKYSHQQADSWSSSFYAYGTGAGLLGWVRTTHMEWSCLLLSALLHYFQKTNESFPYAILVPWSSMHF